MPEYTRPHLVSEVKRTELPRSGHTRSGYGPKIPSAYMVKYGGIWYRVYFMQYANSGTPYIISRGHDLVLDTETEHKLQDA